MKVLNCNGIDVADSLSLLLAKPNLNAYDQKDSLITYNSGGLLKHLDKSPLLVNFFFSLSSLYQREVCSSPTLNMGKGVAFVVIVDTLSTKAPMLQFTTPVKNVMVPVFSPFNYSFRP